MTQSARYEVCSTALFYIEKMNHRTHEKAYTFDTQENLIKSTSYRGRRYGRGPIRFPQNLITQVWLESDR